ncbi:lipopolysaccharide biosynthesis protein [Paraflavisolibacter sp. H34]|uniref:lipopolysaccharide biosynthesis protein n=1 Tax=Huijunlia imazamoxiresistens TaxID=3127457 RepID=UPI003017ED91
MMENSMLTEEVIAAREAVAEPQETCRYQQKWFDKHHLKKNLKEQSVKGGFSTLGSQMIMFVLTIGSNMILARLLAPEYFGLVAMVTAFTGVVTIFSDLGLSTAIIQKEAINHRQVSAVFWINAGITTAIALVLALLAPVLVGFYHEERLLRITLAFAGGIFLSGLGLQHSALMKRQMRFKALSLVQIASTAAGVLAAVLLAWAGFGYWAIVAVNVLPQAFLTLFLWMACDWRPGFYLKAANLRSILGFGAGITGFDLVNYFSRNMDNMLIGRFVGSAGLGLYSKAYQLLMLPINQLRNPLNTVALPALSSLQSDPGKFAAFFRRYVFTLAFFSMPVVVFLGVFSNEVILMVLGPQWVEAGLIFKILAIPAFVQPIAGAQGLVLITTGKVKKYFRIGLVNSFFTVLSFCVGIQWGVTGVALAYAGVTWLLLFPSVYFCFRGTPVSLGLFVRETALPALFAVGSGGVMLGVKGLTGSWPVPLVCAAGGAAGGLMYLLLWQMGPACKGRFRQILEMGDMIRKKGNPSPAPAGGAAQ